MNELKTEIYQIAILLRSLKRKALHKNFFIKDVFSECDQIHKKCGLVTFTEKALNGKLYFLCNEVQRCGKEKGLGVTAKMFLCFRNLSPKFSIK